VARKIIRKKVNTTARKKKKDSFLVRKLKIFGLVLGIVLLFFSVAYHYREGLAYYFSYKTDKVLKQEQKARKLAIIRNFQILSKHKNKAIGIDVSEYQGNIYWQKVKCIDEVYEINFVLIRATAGKDRVDAQFERNWENVKSKKMIRGAYHYYRPNENSLQQANFFIKNVKLKKGDLPPVLDIEKLPKNQPLDSLKVGLKRWLLRVENYYSVKPIIYSGDKYFTTFLEKQFSDYTFWIANYSVFDEKIDKSWQFWQFTENANVDGIKGNVDLNIFNGTKTQLKDLTIGN
jgi:lysozyme